MYVKNEGNENEQSVTCPLKMPLQYQKNVKISMPFLMFWGGEKGDIQW